MTAFNNQQRINIPSLDSLRVLFMAVIFLHHMELYPNGGGIAVSFFFVLSGFALTIGYKDRVLQSNFSYRKYAKKRLFKLVPIHWVMLIVSLILCGIGWMYTEFSWAKLLTNILLLQSFIPDQDLYFAYNSPSWYLCNTVFFSLLFPFILRGICKSNMIQKISLLAAIVAVYVSLFLFLPKDYYHSILYVNPLVRLIDFIIGIYCGLFFLAYKERETNEETTFKPATIACMVCLLVAFLISILHPENGSVFYLIRLYWLLIAPFILLFSIGTMTDTYVRLVSKSGGGIFCVVRWLRGFGKYSFAFYMIHYPCIRAVGPFCRYLRLNATLTTIATFFVVIIAAVIIQNYIIEPIDRLLMRKFNK